MIGPDVAVSRLHGRSLDDRQQVALNALTRNVGAVCLLAGHDLVDFVDENDADALGQFDRGRVHFFLIDERLALLLEDDLAGLLGRDDAKRRDPELQQ